jgi:hypothetical protein
MSTFTLQQFIGMYCMFLFNDGSAQAGMIVNRFNVPDSSIEYFFVPEENINVYNQAKEEFNTEMYAELRQPIEVEEIVSATPLEE